MHNILLFFVAFCVALLPVYIWGYWISYLSGTPWNRPRFLLGMIIWSLSVLLVWLFSYFSLTRVDILFAGWVFFVLLSAVIYLMIYRGSTYARWLLLRFATVNIFSIAIILFGSLFAAHSIPGGAILFISVVPLLISSLIEESSKHLMSIWLMSHDFAFSRRDIVIFTLFVVLGFVFAENLLYLFQWHLSLSTWIFRSFFSLIAHLLASIICAYAWWRAIWYEPASFHYIAIFSLGFISATLTHLLYNMILEQGSMIGLGLYTIVAYIVVTRGIMR